MKNFEDITVFVDSPEGFLRAIAMSQNALAPTCTICCEDVQKVFGTNPIQEMQTAAEYMNAVDGSFARAQLKATAYEYKEFPFRGKASVKMDRTYMCTPKEVNDVRCLAAEIGGILRKSLGETPTFERAVRVYQKWINRYFNYKKTGELSDYTAIGLLKNRTGVCQAIAAVTMLVFPYLGFPVVFVAGEGKGDHEWGSHAWNAIKTDKGWVHVDFTFGMSDFYTPHTNNKLMAKAFRRDHRWDEHHLSQESMSQSTALSDAVRNSHIALYENKHTLSLGKNAVRFCEPMMVGNAREGHWVDLSRLLPLLGGSCEWLPTSNRLRICLHDKVVVIEDAASLIDKQTGYVSVAVLTHFATILGGSESSVIFKIA